MNSGPDLRLGLSVAVTFREEKKTEKLRRSRKDEKGEADRERRGGDTKKREEESEGEIGRRGGGTEEEAEEQVDRGGDTGGDGGGEGEEETEEMQR